MMEQADAMFGIGTPELIFIFLVGFFIFGPRQLPEIGRRLGEIMGQLRRAADDFKQTWEAEVESERARLAKAMPSVSIDLGPTPSLAGAEVTPAEGTLARTPAGAPVAASEPSLSEPPAEPLDAQSPFASADTIQAAGADAIFPPQSPQSERPLAPAIEAVGYEG
ncbi:MAG: hypothetical protein CFK52_02835 [Chloracidobacterium sp. CP2_5A]|nr:MAG: hypothetical protein CFK52_02835 [Chloracidobacterium sp. CP2_5A]